MSAENVSTGTTDPSTPPSALNGRKVAIVGAGIGGLTCAIALALRGADVQIFERAEALREVGAGIQVSPNAVRVLTALGLGEELDSIAPRSGGVRMRDASGRNVATLDFSKLRPHAPFHKVHRARLLQILQDRALALGVTIKLGQEVRDPVPLIASHDLVIGADGVKSVIRKALNGPETPAYTGQTAWRALIPCDTPAQVWADLFMGSGRHLVSYPLGNGLRNIVAVLEQPVWKHEGWSHRDDPENLRRAFAGFGGPVPAWLDQVTQTGIWGLYRHPVASCWQNGNMAILGDAAHPTLPFMAQGACMAIEDGWVLAASLAQSSDQSAALLYYEALRMQRCRQIVAMADGNAQRYHLDGWKRRAAHFALGTASAFAPNLLYRQVAWIYDFDPTKMI